MEQTSEISSESDEHQSIHVTPSDAIFEQEYIVKQDVLTDSDSVIVALKRLATTAKVALKSNWLPALVLNTVALIILLLFFSVESVNEFFTSIAELKDRVGLPFGIVSTSIAAGVVPSIFMAIRHARTSQRLRENGQLVQRRVPRIEYEALFLIVFWGYRGLEADLFYRLQAIVVGSSGSAGEVVLKVMIDMLVYNPAWACSQVLVMYFWKDANFTIKPAYDKFMTREYWTFILPSALITTWIVWTPACAIIYCMPAGLQLILMNIVCCFWSILLQIVTKTDSSIADKAEQLDGQTIQFHPTHEQYENDSDVDLDDEDELSDDEEQPSQPGALYSTPHIPHHAEITQAETLH